jgi:hypothetical protein
MIPQAQDVAFASDGSREEVRGQVAVSTGAGT